MTLPDVRAALLAGGLGERMGHLTDTLCKPLVPYAASCRLVDFSVANTARSGIPELVLLSLHRERDLIDHLLTHWDGRGVRINFGPHDTLVRSGALTAGETLPARPPEAGTADALLNNAEHLFAPGARDLLIQHADHVYLYDYTPMVAAHRTADADVTIGVQRIEHRFVHLFGMVDVDPDLRVRRLVEKPAEPTSDLIFTAFCLFKTAVLRDVLTTLAALGDDAWQHDISRDVLPHMIREGHRVLAHPITGYWADIGTVERYHLEQLKLLDPPFPLPPGALPTTLTGTPPHHLGHARNLTAADVTIPPGATVHSSLLFPGCVIEPGARIDRSIVLPGATVRAGARLNDTIAAPGEDVTGRRTGLTHLEPAAHPTP
ncbi:sugar phosphate nucleotidyltransferase [Actinoallomurus spadix]|uniref:Glucose-1-phosphate adenylyltransferase n=1 Tax=Actinoallomurus spadix TaxID=79912 RepID=A0ABN0WRR5_9ACTN|nr:sugar phosphate nucleotidyltransferase [Actinoallomurus spadix]MCO5990984.1 sugar phosphate nucleotidyltransferase [Actinoallomurus spadix]